MNRGLLAWRQTDRTREQPPVIGRLFPARYYATGTLLNCALSVEPDSAVVAD